MATFAGMAPYQKPKFAAVVNVIKPDRAHRFGGVASAPVFSKVVKKVLQLYADKAKDIEKVLYQLLNSNAMMARV